MSGVKPCRPLLFAVDVPVAPVLAVGADCSLLFILISEMRVFPESVSSDSRAVLTRAFQDGWLQSAV